MAGIPNPIPRTVEEVFRDFRGRRAGLIKALTTDLRKFYDQCDPKKGNLCLFGFPNAIWELKDPDKAPPEFPEPMLGINFARDGMLENEWIYLVAVHSDAWLISTAFYFGLSQFRKNERNRLFQMINDLPTIVDIVTSSDNEKKDQSSNDNSNKRKTSGGDVENAVFSNFDQSRSQTKASNMSSPSREEDKDEEAEVCGVCEQEEGDEFWIFCDNCERWYHGICVKVTAEEAENIKSYRCQSCSNKKIRV